jgi:OmpA-OmpF porin, OOP family
MNLNKTLYSLLFAVLLLGATTSTYSQAGKYNLSFRILSNNYEQPQTLDSKIKDAFSGMNISGAEIGIHRKISDRFTLGVPISLGVAKFKRANNLPLDRRSSFIGNLDLLATFYATKSSKWLRPYIQLGPSVQRNWTADTWVGQFPVGLGMALNLGGGAFLDFGTHYRTSSNDVNGWAHHAGVTMGIGGSDMEPEMPKGPVDSDGDGINNIADKCPDTPGLAAFMGCPDTDGDGIVDTDDKCPDAKGTVAMMGCPDADGDGIVDNDDKCPDVKGSASMMGCPDTDGDGIADASDKCPTVRGVASTMGCPDGDGDGIADADDKCPSESGPRSNNGCPVKAAADRDGDGVADTDDACPDTKGDAKYKGCPDTDGDGVANNTDKCPNEAGPASNAGCPEIKKEDKARIDFAIKNIRFKTGNNILTTESNAILDEIAGLMGKYPGYYLSIAGHTDSDGDAAANQTLSEKRAKACNDYLVSKGVAAVRLSHAGYGETIPISDNTTAAGKQANRRVDFNMFIPK